MRKLLVAILGLVSLVSANKVCLNTTETGEYMTRLIGKTDSSHRLDGDMNAIARMKMSDLTFARVDEIEACADEEYVHGFRFTLKQHKTSYNERTDLTEEERIMK